MLQSADVLAYLALPVCIIIAQFPFEVISISVNIRKSFGIREIDNRPFVSVTG